MLFIYSCHHARGHNSLSWMSRVCLLLKIHQSSWSSSSLLLLLPPSGHPPFHLILSSLTPQSQAGLALPVIYCSIIFNPGPRTTPRSSSSTSLLSRSRSPPRLLVRYKCQLHPPILNLKAHRTSLWRSPSPRLKSRLPRPAPMPTRMQQRPRCRCIVAPGQVRALPLLPHFPPLVPPPANPPGRHSWAGAPFAACHVSTFDIPLNI